jgi:hypothetical protein
MLFNNFSRLVVLSLVAFVFLMGCSDDSDNTVGPAAGSSSSKVRVIHASYDAPGVDISVDGTVAISNLAFGESSGYAEVGAGLRSIVVTPTGATTPEVISADVPVEATKEYTVLAVNNLANIEPILTEDLRASVGNKAKIRFVHASPDAPAVDIKLNSGSGPAVFSDVQFKEFSAYAEVDAGSYQFVVTATGATAEVVVFDPITVQNGIVYTVVALGTLDNTDAFPFTVRVFVDNDQGAASVDLAVAKANVLVTHSSPDAPGVDLLLDNIVVNSLPLTFPNNTGYLEVGAGTRNIKVNATGTTTTVINADVTFVANNSYSVFAVNDLSNIEPLVLEDDLTPPAAGNAHVRFIHLSPDAPAVDVTLTDGTIVFGNKSFKESTDFTPLATGTYNLEVRLAGTSTVVLPLNGIVLEDGNIYTVFAKGFVGGSGMQALNAEIIVND